MITLIYGSYGCGKTTAVINSIVADTEKNIHTFLLVPEQEAVQIERKTLYTLPSSAQLDLEVLNFSRLYNRVCREYGGLSYQYVTKPIKSLLMWHNLRELAPLLEQYGDMNLSDSSMADIMIQAINEFKACCITPDDLESTANKLATTDPLRAKLRDLALIYTSFDALISQNYSDSSDDLSRLADILKKRSFFNNCNVYIDSFTSFTAVEHKIIERIFESADNVTVTIPLPSPNHNDISTAGIRKSLEKIKISAEKHGGYREIVLKKNMRTESPMLAYLSENLWKLDASGKDYTAYSDGSIVAEICDTPYAEAEAAANHTLELLRRGERCRDIVVMMRDAEKYRGIIEPAFAKNNIPFFFSEKTDLCSLPPVKLILTALRIKQYNWRRSDVISHIKTGLCDTTPRSADLFEEYINTWNIQGSKFTGDDWSMNPNGFVAEEMKAREFNILAAANEVRHQLVGPLEKLFVLLDASENIPDMCRAVFSYLEEINLEDKLHDLAKREAQRKQNQSAQETAALYGIILSALADIASALPDAEADTEAFIAALKIVFGKLDIGIIPTSVDEVTIGSASMLRTSNPKYVMVLGLCEGEFPAVVNDTGLLNSGDRTTLFDLGIELSADTDTRSSDELMYVHRAFSSPSHKLFVFTSKAEITGKGRTPSLPFLRIQKLFPELHKPHVYDGTDLRYLTPAPQSSASLLRIMKNSSDAKALAHALEEYLPDVSRLSEEKTSADDCHIDKETANEVFGNRLNFSATSFESYVRCPFNYYCSYVLGLRERKTAKFHANIIGTFIHHILEELIKEAIPTSKEFNIPEDDELIAKVERSVNDYILRIYPQELGESKKLTHLYRRLKNLALLLIRNIVKEFSHSKFKPVFFELKADGKNGNPSPMKFDLNNEATVSFSGIIDRVDIFKHDDKVYIRVVDYKTGSKNFSLSDIDLGINTQMLLYLFTLCRTENKEFRTAVGADKTDEFIPAGAVYLSANIPVIEAEDYEDSDEVLKEAEKKLKRSGLLLNEEEVLLAMNDSLSSEFLMGVKRNKEGALCGSALATNESFNDIFLKMQNTILKISNQLIGGNANAEPLEVEGETACRFCNMKPICRKNEN